MSGVDIARRRAAAAEVSADKLATERKVFAAEQRLALAFGCSRGSQNLCCRRAPGAARQYADALYWCSQGENRDGSGACAERRADGRVRWPLIERGGLNQRLASVMKVAGLDCNHCSFTTPDAIAVDAIAQRVAVQTNFERSSLLVLLQMRQQAALRAATYLRDIGAPSKIATGSKYVATPGIDGSVAALQGHHTACSPRFPRAMTPPGCRRVSSTSVAAVAAVAASSGSPSAGNSIRARGWVRTRLAKRAAQGLGDSPRSERRVHEHETPSSSARISVGAQQEWKEFREPAAELQVDAAKAPGHVARITPNGPKQPALLKSAAGDCCRCCAGTNGDHKVTKGWAVTYPVLVCIACIACIACCWLALLRPCQAFVQIAGMSMTVPTVSSEVTLPPPSSPRFLRWPDV